MNNLPVHGPRQAIIPRPLKLHRQGSGRKRVFCLSTRTRTWAALRGTSAVKRSHASELVMSVSLCRRYSARGCREGDSERQAHGGVHCHMATRLIRRAACIIAAASMHRGCRSQRQIATARVCIERTHHAAHPMV